MKPTRVTIVNALGLTMLSLLTSSSWLAAQDQPRSTEAPLRYIVKDLGTLGGSRSTATGINDRGAVVGSANTPNDQSSRAFLWRNGTMIDLGTLGGVNSQIQWPGIDDRDSAAGSAEISTLDPFNEDFCGFDDTSGVLHTGLICRAFLWHHGVMIALPTLGGNNSAALSLNNAGQVVGMAETTTQDPNCVPPQFFDVAAVVWGPEPGEIHPLPPLPGDLEAWATGINDSGVIIGDSGACLSPNFNAPTGLLLSHAAIWRNGNVTSLGTLGGTFANAAAINAKGQVAGHSTLPSDTTVHTFLWHDGILHDLGVVAGDFLSVGYGLNDLGQVVGGSCDQNFNCRAFLWQDGTMTDLNSLVKSGSSSLHLIFGYAINDRSEIALYALDQNSGNTHAAVAFPCDESHADEEGCNAAARETLVDSADTTVLPANVRRQLQERMGRGMQTVKPQ